MKKSAQVPSFTKKTDILEKLATSYSGLTKAHKRLADCIISNPMESVGQTITELAIRAGVSDATVTRFCTTQGLSGYPDLRKSLVYAIEMARKSNWKILSDDPNNRDVSAGVGVVVPENCRTIYPTTNKYEEVVKIICGADRLILAGLGPAAFLCEFLHGYFAGRFLGLMSVGLAGAAIAEKHIKTGTNRDVLIIFPSLDTPLAEERLVHIAGKRGMRIIAANQIEDDKGTNPVDSSDWSADRRLDHINILLASAKKIHQILEATILEKDASISKKSVGHL